MALQIILQQFEFLSADCQLERRIPAENFTSGTEKNRALSCRAALYRLKKFQIQYIYTAPASVRGQE